MSSKKLVSVNVGIAKMLDIGSKRVMSAIDKTPINTPFAKVNPLGIEGDEQVEISCHGGLQMAVYAYPIEHYPFWENNGEKLKFGTMGENLSISGLLETETFVGDELHFSNCILRVSKPREPCYKFNAVMRDNLACKKMIQSGFSGFYLSVVFAGTLTVGEEFELVAGSQNISIYEKFKR